ncbi:TetR family transcriptional regulator [Paenibacillus sp. J31TS4]|uniref:TetR/AcrR family transcriptional regulator n=1 Tax=Paenibacillus sp. J31TS4 TaxID=2807195 RepID=UPI001B177B75|nr:TetR/AcrR family transcriptional regulator [Paenibacillus sp. J31TS4]GIP39304.1 TetR family transcriptional regulator [Paenibacillus sp. J31TS4]
MAAPNKRSPGRPKRGEADPKLKETILQTASRAFMEMGFEAVSLEQIAQTCGITKASIYYYFPNKAALFSEAIVRMMGNIRRLTASLMEQPLPLRTRLEQVAEGHMRQAHLEFEGLMKEAGPSLSEEQVCSIREAERLIHEEMAERFRQAMASGDIREADPMLLAYGFEAIMMMSSRDRLLARFPSPAEAAKAIVELYWYGLAPVTR